MLQNNRTTRKILRNYVFLMFLNPILIDQGTKMLYNKEKRETIRKGGDVVMLEGFKVYNLSVGLPAMSITQNGVAFNKTSVLKLGYPEHVLILTNTQEKKIAIQVCDQSQESATPFYKGKKDANVVSVRWNNKDLMKTISSIMDWNLENAGYKIEGEYIEGENALVFDLIKATEIS